MPFRILGFLLLLLAGALCSCAHHSARLLSGRVISPHVRPEVFTHTHPPGVFRDVAQTAGIRFHNTNGAAGRFYFVETTPGGCAFFDYDNDGLLDIFLCQPGNTPHGASPGGAGPDGPFCKLYHNDGHGHFTDVTRKMGLEIPMNYVQGVTVGDYDNDGYEDLYITAYGGNHLLHNEHGKRFRDVTREAGVGDTDQGVRWATAAAFGDYDNDGRLDLIVLHYLPWSPATDRYCKDTAGHKDYCTPEVYGREKFRLFHNDGGGHFTDVSRKTGIDAVSGRGLGVIWMDTTHTGHEDLFIANDLTPQLLLRNRDGRHFEDIGVVNGVAFDPDGQLMSGMGVAAADDLNTGWESLAVTNFSAKPDVLYRGLPGGQFRNDTYASGIGFATLKTLAFGVSFLDYNRDGLPDLVVGNGHVDPQISVTQSGTTYEEREQLFRNNGDGTYTDAVPDLGDMAIPHVTRGLAVGDFDNDGRLDVLTNNLNGPACLYHNESRDQHHWISLRLEGVKCNRDGAGALVWLTAGRRRRLSECRLGSSFLSSCDKRIYFGLGDATAIDRIEIRWPDGMRQAMPRVKPDHFYWLREGSGLQVDPRVKETG